MIIYSTYGDTFETSKLYLTQHSLGSSKVLSSISRKAKRSELKTAFRLKWGKTVAGKYSTWPQFQLNMWFAKLIRENQKITEARIGCQIFTGENLVKLLKWVRG